MPLDVDHLRRTTPGVEDHIHLNSAGAALPTQTTIDVQVAHLKLEARIGGYRAAHQEAERLDGVRSSVARLIGAGPHEVAMHRSATDAWNTALLAIASTLSRGDRVLVDRALYGSHAITLLRLSELWGLRVVLVGNDHLGQLDLGALTHHLDGAALACLTHVPTSSGLVNPLRAAGALCADAEVPLLVDACQSIGQLPVHVDTLQCAALASTGRKYLRGPRGTGFLYVRQACFDRFPPIAPDLRAAVWLAPNQIKLHDDARRYESWERGFAAELGLGVAVDDVLRIGMDAIATRIASLASQLRAGLSDVPGVTVHDRGEQLCGICTFSVDGQPPQEVANALQRADITVSVSRASSAHHDLGARGIDAVVRASVHAYNTEDELQKTIVAVHKQSAGA